MPCEGGPCEDIKPEFDKVTRLLCEICETYQYAEDFDTLSSDLRSWWKQHQKEDAARIEKENRRKKVDLIKKRALAKLTSQERAALGIR